MEPLISLTFDVEEFDVIEEFGGSIPADEFYLPSRLGLDKLLPLLEREKIPATLFCTAAYVENQTAQMARALEAGHEIASHGLKHSRLDEGDLAASKEKIESLLGIKLQGFRAPRFAAVAPAQIAQAGYAYDSSINPTWLPGRYNYSTWPKTPFEHGQTIEIPASVTPMLRFPLFWLSFKNLPLGLYTSMCLRNLRHYGFLNLVFHPWEFSDLTNRRLPWYVKRIHGDALLARLESLIASLRPHGQFARLDKHLEQFAKPVPV
ncbi:polysaccharide deacetylase family protein [Kamptonema cortianum]|uniref:Polysaccharide deacetylase family protein n=1 Tax=Geitlerinema calcuttense NRMC-F 0142 TaxID=2922238 RepID=A0ABT7LX64_9CYAN|nr:MULTISPECIES: polysaccharide deacetylase family protein [Cyanophyceae]MDK3156634.1 polysaccharide deacetylase family protein [Kamptonema cortianum]MDL5050355.1 polysaccharide deacetylase family protein [Oscillatoria amoena NRMC-F 0135]MDL5053373.1 polysaccharide deacetylase family protein [Oscillatoria laete-virens NRMC-F 0139]MDL5056592.1 polysaccharide deacetylase family protein [Geitlerinema calcuttense NRMC-F 0142]